MKKKSTSLGASNLPVSKQTAGGVTGAIVGGVVAGPIGAVVGAVAGTVMGNRSAKGKSLIPDSISQEAEKVAKAVKAKLPSMKEVRSVAVKTVKKLSSKSATRTKSTKTKVSTKVAVVKKKTPALKAAKSKGSGKKK